MKSPLNTPTLALKRQTIRPTFSEQIAWDDNLAREVAEPLFEEGLLLAAITERRGYGGRGGPYPYHDVRLLLQGSMRLEAQGATQEVRPGDLVVCPAGEPLTLSASKEGVWWLYFKLTDLPKWAPFKRHGVYVRPYEHALLMYQLLRDILDAMAMHQPRAAAQALNEARALADLLHHELSWGAGRQTRRTESLQELMAEMAAWDRKDWDVRQMAARMALSPQQLTRVFKSELGITPGQLIVRQRMKLAARDLLNTKLAIARVAEQHGYDSLHSFTRLFAKHIGIPPGRYRKRYAPERRNG